MIKQREFTNVLQFKLVFTVLHQISCCELKKSPFFSRCRYFKVLVQEMGFKLDTQFVNALIDVAIREKESEEQKRERFKADMATVHTQLLDFAEQSSSDEQRHFYDNLHISPLKVC